MNDIFTPESEVAPAPDKHPVFCITPLSKYLALVLFIILPFLGGYVGYVLSPVKTLTVEKIKVVKESKTQSDGQTVDLTKYNLLVSRYLQENNNIEQAFEVSHRQLSDEVSLLTVCVGCSHAPSFYLVYNEVSEEVVRFMDWDGVPFEQAGKWVTLYSQDFEKDSNLLYVAVNESEVTVYDFARNTNATLYSEDDPNITLCESVGVKCDTAFAVTNGGEVLFPRFSTEDQTVLLDVKAVRITDEFRLEEN